ncbi:MAG: TM0106 family RecB-like putative nuclease [Pseudolysinimonas sp.]
MRRLDARLGRIDRVAEVADPMMARAGVLGGVHERSTLERFVDEYGEHHPGEPGGVAVLASVSATDRAAMDSACAATIAALEDGAAVIYQATFSTDDFAGFADFLIRTPSGSYEVYDSKLARKAKITALLQLAAYARELRRLGVPVGPAAHLLLGDGTTSSHRLDDIEPVFEERWRRLRAMVDERMVDSTAITWGALGYLACGRCAECVEQIEATDDVLLVAGLSLTQRARLAQAGIHTIDQLAASAGKVDGIGGAALATLRDQAAMQLEGKQSDDITSRVYDASALIAIPEPDAGDIFFDFEGDPMWTDGHNGWNLEYLFGVIEHEDGEREHFRPFWAHDRAEEKVTTLAFLNYVAERRRQHPAMHIYHYADYERSHLQQLCARHGVGEQILDELLREHVFVDLFPIVKKSIRISANSYSLKKVEHLYMGDELRDGDVTNAADSVEQYVNYGLARDAGDLAEAARLLEQIADYNRYDCVSTLRLRDWLIERADAKGIGRRPQIEPAVGKPELDLERREDAVVAKLLASLNEVPIADRTPEQVALALTAAAVDYHRREDKTSWWEHFNRQIAPVDTWENQRDVMIIDSVTVLDDWAPPSRANGLSKRTLELRGHIAPGSKLGIGSKPFAMYDWPPPSGIGEVEPGQRGDHQRTDILSVASDGEVDVVVLQEGTRDLWADGPMALTPEPPLKTPEQRAAILEWGELVAERVPGLPSDPSADILLRRAPRIAGGLSRGGAPIDDIVSSLQSMTDSYIAVQGPPGSGKTYVGAGVIADLVRRGWKVGVVAQSHAVVENLLGKVLGNGIPAAQVAKKSGTGDESAKPWTRLKKNEDFAPFLRAVGGLVVGGTAWDFASNKKVPRHSLDLLVIDEAGQYSLANTIAVAMSAKRLLLLGDPQQLPQVSQGVHPEPIESSALGWLSNGEDVLPDELGYFLSETRRMHPDLCAAVSALSYDGRLKSKLPETTDRRLDGIAPGLHPSPVVSHDRSVESPEEAAATVRLVEDLVGRPWVDLAHSIAAGPLTPADIIVVAPYNAQVAALRAALDAAGFANTPVGTVDKFQGQEAPVAILSITASSAQNVTRGIDFLLLRNRLNVAVSRAQWAAYLLYSPELRTYLPTRPEGLAQLSGFIRLTNY